MRDDYLEYVMRHFKPPAEDEATIVCDPASSLDGWTEQVVRRMGNDGVVPWPAASMASGQDARSVEDAKAIPSSPLRIQILGKDFCRDV